MGSCPNKAVSAVMRSRSAYDKAHILLLTRQQKSRRIGGRQFSTGYAVGDSVPEHMHYVAHDEAVGLESFKVATQPVPSYDRENERLIRVAASAVNRADYLQCMGKYPPPKGVTSVLGLECAGHVVDPITNQITDRKVMALLSGGGYADYVKVHKDHMIEIPEGMSMQQAAAIPEAWVTAYQLTCKIGQIKRDETALIYAGASGVGTAMIQLCTLRGASSIAIASSLPKIQQCMELGSFDGISYLRAPKFSERVQLITDHEGVDLILDPVLGSFFDESLNCLGYDARWIIYGTMGGFRLKEGTNMLKLLGKRASIHTSTLRNRTDEYKTELISEMANECMPAFSSGTLKPILDREYKMSDVKEAFTRLQQNLNIGKIVLTNDM